MNYLEKAKSALTSIGIQLENAPPPVLALLDQISHYDADKVTLVAATLQQSSAFNAAVRDQIAGMQISTRYADITSRFDSIREDATKMLDWMGDGKLDFKEKLQLQWMKIQRGSVPDRFNDIRNDYLDVAKSAADQIARETVILNAYVDFRLALKSAEVAAQDVLRAADVSLATAKQKLAAASDAVTAHAEGDAGERVRLELTRDEALRAVQGEDKAYQIAKDIADDLRTGCNTADLVFARLQQTHAVKERLYQRAVSFFATNEVVLTGLAASFTSMGGLAEATNTVNAMTEGVSKGLESLATTGGQQLDAALKAGYGSTLRVDSIKALAESVVDFQTSSLRLIEELRVESTLASEEIAAATESSRRRYAALLEKGVPA